MHSMEPEHHVNSSNHKKSSLAAYMGFIEHKDTRGFICPSDDGIFSDPTNCENFYVCSAGDAKRVKCLSGYAFEPTKKRCVPRSQVTSCVDENNHGGDQGNVIQVGTGSGHGQGSHGHGQGGHGNGQGQGGHGHGQGSHGTGHGQGGPANNGNGQGNIKKP